jgi:hypothetical protein
MTLNIDDLRSVSPSLFNQRGNIKNSVDLTTKYRVVWKGQVYRPIKAQQVGVVSERHTLVLMDLIQVMPDELVNDSQFLAYAQA